MVTYRLIANEAGGKIEIERFADILKLASRSKIAYYSVMAVKKSMICNYADYIAIYIGSRNIEKIISKIRKLVTGMAVLCNWY